MGDIWSWNNAVDGDGTVLSSVSGSAGDLVTANLRDPRVGRVWRAGGMPAELRIGLPALAGVSVIGLFNANLPDLGSLTIGLGTSDGSSDLWSFDVPADTLRASRQVIALVTDTDGALAGVNATHAVVKATGSVPLEIGRLWIGVADWEPQVSHSVDGTAWGVIDRSTFNDTPRAGARIGDRGARLRTFTAGYDSLYPDEMFGALLDMDDRGLLGQLLFVPAPEVYPSSRMAILGYARELAETRFLGFLRGGRTLSIVEAG